MNISEIDLSEKLLIPIENMGLKLWGIIINYSQNSATVRVFIDKTDAVTIDDCERATYQISNILDVEDCFDNPYTLEISSPGLDRQLFNLSQYERYTGSTISVSLTQPYEGRKNLKGILNAIINNDVILHVNGHEYQLPFNHIHKAKLTPFANAN